MRIALACFRSTATGSSCTGVAAAGGGGGGAGGAGTEGGTGAVTGAVTGAATSAATAGDGWGDSVSLTVGGAACCGTRTGIGPETGTRTRLPPPCRPFMDDTNLGAGNDRVMPLPEGGRRPGGFEITPGNLGFGLGLRLGLSAMFFGWGVWQSRGW